MPNINMQIGTPVNVKIGGVMTPAKYAGWSERYNMPEVEVNGRRMPRKIYGVNGVVNTSISDNGEVTETMVPDAANLEVTTNCSVVGAEVVRRNFPINQRFTFLEKMVGYVGSCLVNSLIITGPGGLGKSYTVFEKLRALSLEEDVDYVCVKGFSTPKSLYRKLFEQREGGLIIFDDCDSVLQNDTALNILKSALESSEERVVSWLSEQRASEDQSLPERFVFSGRVIFVSNLPLRKISQALLSRALYVDVAMSSAEKIERMRGICEKMKPELTLADKTEVIDFLAELKDQVLDLNIRTFLKVCDLKIADPTDWRGIAEYVVTS